MMTRYGSNPDSMLDAGIAYAVDQIVDLLSHGVDGVHIYIMNNPVVAKRIYDAVINLI
jgi:methylenetetrahydrofolate reductase (NADPH)